MNPAFLENMSWEMAEVYGAITDQILINLARHFPFYVADNVPTSAFAYQAQMLAQMGQVNKETIQIIRNNLDTADEALKRVLEQSVIDAVRTAEPELLDAVKAGILKPAGMPIVAPQQMRAFQLYYQQASEKLNLVNTVMLESTKSAYQQCISDVVSEIELADRLNRTQIALDAATGEVVTGVSSWNMAVKHATERMANGGITGFVDHGGHQWSAEAYTAMDIRTTVFNTARSAVWETNEDFGNDLYMVSYHNGARPLCYPWQNKVISSTNNARVTYDLDGNEIQVIAQSATSYGEAAGLFGVNCKHYPTPFIPGVSIIRGQPQNEEENAKTYAESQEQRRLERKLREQKRDLEMLKAQGAPEEQIKAQREKCKKTSQDIDDFCESTGRQRRRNRESVYTKRDFPDADKYDVTAFENQQKERIQQFYQSGGAQQGYNFGEMTQKQPIVPPAPVTPANVAPQATQTTGNAVQSNTGKSALINRLDKVGIQRMPVQAYTIQPTEDEIIAKLAGADKTRGSCSSVALAYCGNKNGLDVTDFRGGMSQMSFSQMNNIKAILDIDGIDGKLVSGYNDFTNAHKLLKEMQEGKEYYFTCGKHAAIVRKTATGNEYLEMQSGFRKNTWYALNDYELKRRFGAQKSHSTYGMKYESYEVIFDIATAKGKKEFEEMLEFINTSAGAQMKGVGGGEK